ncbi:MAG: sulfate reduction electron transfer complex DsrMKJOP subunit DsrJ [Desulfobacca sp.]|uniref:sulfate reduction electron transfer complex DsrMKJOP subunit DsrJ n=1 Tax=Desulfobacca sp. TaxID=2067990 RepID=UPI00404A6CFC
MESNGNYKNEFGWFAEKPQVPKKLYHAKAVVGGLVIFLILVTAPLWRNLGKVVPAPDPKLNTQAILALPEKDRTCVEDTAFMRANHMRLLVDWRDEVVRNANRDYINSKGKRYLASLSNNCMECHSNKSQFCDQCHNYVSVAPNCWGCHWEKEKKQVAQTEAK